MQRAHLVQEAQTPHRPAEPEVQTGSISEAGRLRQYRHRDNAAGASKHDIQPELLYRTPNRSPHPGRKLRRLGNEALRPAVSSKRVPCPERSLRCVEEQSPNRTPRSAPLRTGLVALNVLRFPGKSRVTADTLLHRFVCGQKLRNYVAVFKEAL